VSRKLRRSVGGLRGVRRRTRSVGESMAEYSTPGSAQVTSNGESS
jgi:hypothetical protein